MNVSYEQQCKDLLRLYSVAGLPGFGTVCRTRYKDGLLDTRDRDDLVQQVFASFGDDLGPYVGSFYNKALDYALLLRNSPFVTPESVDALQRLRELRKECCDAGSYSKLVTRSFDRYTVRENTVRFRSFYNDACSFERLTKLQVAALYFVELLKNSVSRNAALDDETFRSYRDLCDLQDLVVSSGTYTVPVDKLFSHLCHAHSGHRGTFTLRDRCLVYKRFSNNRPCFVSAKFVEPFY